jgi:hypothetical protein
MSDTFTSPGATAANAQFEFHQVRYQTEFVQTRCDNMRQDVRTRRLELEFD